MRFRQDGMTMIELLVAMTIGVAVTLVVATVLVAGENLKRTTTSTNDAEQTGAYAFYALERYLRGAGSAIAESAAVSTSSGDAGVLGCILNVAGILPRATPFPAPFAGVLGGAAATLQVAPVLIARNQSAGGSAGASDALIIMGGSGTGGGVSRPLVLAGSVTGTTASVPLESAEGFKPYDYVLLSQSGVVQPSNCLLEEVDSSQSLTAPTPPLPLRGSADVVHYPYYTAGAATTLASLVANTSTYVTGLGNVKANDLQYQMIGVGANDTLYGYDLLQYQSLVQGQTVDASQAIADGVVAMYAIYGVSTATSGPGVLGYWVDPADAAYNITTVMNNETTMETIIAVRVGLIVRGEYYDKNVVSPASFTLFSGYVDGPNHGNSLQRTVNINATQRHYRYRTFEFTVPLRNMLILAGTS
jgi:type IV pilus assembly protein PilW